MNAPSAVGPFPPRKALLATLGRNQHPPAGEGNLQGDLRVSELLSARPCSGTMEWLCF